MHVFFSYPNCLYTLFFFSFFISIFCILLLEAVAHLYLILDIFIIYTRFTPPFTLRCYERNTSFFFFCRLSFSPTNLFVLKYYCWEMALIHLPPVFHFCLVFLSRYYQELNHCIICVSSFYPIYLFILLTF